MLRKARQSIELQLLCLLLCTGLSAILGWFFTFYPRARINPEIFAKGLLAGLGVIAAYVVIYALLLVAFPSHTYSSFREISKDLSQRSIPTIIGAGILAGAGEELLFRVYIFSLISSYGFWLALSLHFALMLILYYQGRRHLAQTIVCGLECSLYAVLFYYHRSFFLIAMAHCTAEIGLSFIFRNQGVKACLEKETINFAELKKLFHSKEQ